MLVNPFRLLDEKPLSKHTLQISKHLTTMRLHSHSFALLLSKPSISSCTENKSEGKFYITWWKRITCYFCSSSGCVNLFRVFIQWNNLKFIDGHSSKPSPNVQAVVSRLWNATNIILITIHVIWHIDFSNLNSRGLIGTADLSQFWSYPTHGLKENPIFFLTWALFYVFTKYIFL